MSANKMATKADLQEMYQRMLPYLGGMPEAICNKFDKSNMYSTTEKIVGCWTDGRPLYQKTYIIDASAMPQVTTDGILVDTEYDLGLGTSINVICYKCSRKPSSSINTRMTPTISDDFSRVGLNVYIKSDGKLNISSILTVNNNVALYFTLQYTKTTDAANSFNYADENDYSTEEHVVGTWIDGKPIYQKTIIDTMPSEINIVKSINLGVLIDTVVDYKAMLYSPSSNWYQNINPGTNDSFSGFSKMAVSNNNSSYYPANSINVVTSLAGWGDFTIYVTVQYTKTTD